MNQKLIPLFENYEHSQESVDTKSGLKDLFMKELSHLYTDGIDKMAPELQQVLDEVRRLFLDYGLWWSKDINNDMMRLLPEIKKTYKDIKRLSNALSIKMFGIYKDSSYLSVPDAPVGPAAVAGSGYMDGTVSVDHLGAIEQIETKADKVRYLVDMNYRPSVIARTLGMRAPAVGKIKKGHLLKKAAK
jgi:hypothetical protein